MTVYLDTSDLMKLYVDEIDTENVRDLVASADTIVTSALTYPEARATFARRRRDKLLSSAEYSTMIQQLDADWARVVVVPLGINGVFEAGRLAEAHGLRGADAVHLAAFERLLTSCEDEDVRFSSADDRLTRAAGRLG